jgi:hypothetical protein
MNYMVNLGEVPEVAARKSAAFVSAGNFNPLGRCGTSTNALLIKDGAIAALERENHLGVARQSPRHLGRYWTNS